MLLTSYDSGRRLRRLASAALVAALAVAGSSAGVLAQQTENKNQTPPATDAVSVSGSGWFKLCNVVNQETKFEQCLTSFEVRDKESSQLLVSASVLINKNAPKEARNVILFGAPIGVFLPPGLEAQIDADKPVNIPFTVCSPGSCVAQVEATEEVVGRLKKGSELKITVINPRGQKINFPITLGGFTKTFDGEPMTREEYEKRQSALDEQIRSFVEKRRQEYEEAQKKQEQNKAPEDKPKQ